MRGLENLPPAVTIEGIRSREDNIFGWQNNMHRKTKNKHEKHTNIKRSYGCESNSSSTLQSMTHDDNH